MQRELDLISANISLCAMEFLMSEVVNRWIVPFLFTVLALYVPWRLFESLWLNPLRAKLAFETQGMKGMPYHFFYGNARDAAALFREARSAPMPELSHDIVPRVLPHFHTWSKKLGHPFFFWMGSQPRVFVTDPEYSRQILSNKFGHYRKPVRRPDTNDLIGAGLVFLEGEKWAQHRRILNPAFFVEKLKSMIPTMAACTTSMLDDWEAEIERAASGCKEIDVHKETRKLTGDIIAHTAFGSSFSKGKRVFEIQHEQQFLFEMVVRTVYIPGSRFLPTSTNRYRWKLNNEIQKLLREMIQSRLESSRLGRADSLGNDLLGLMMAANQKELQGNQKNLTMEIGEIVDECKTFFFAGHDTTSMLLTWSLMLLASNPEWQERARAEVMGVSRKEPPTADALNNLRILGMVLNETLRLYPPATVMFRQPCKESMKLGEDLLLPKGAVAVLPILVFHHDAKYWGADVHQFNPQRFADGIAKAGMNPTAFMPFGLGPRTCIGQTFALLEAKIVLSLILQRFSFRMSSTYRHAPTLLVTLQPEKGMQIIFKKLSP